MQKISFITPNSKGHADPGLFRLIAAKDADIYAIMKQPRKKVYIVRKLHVFRWRKNAFSGFLSIFLVKCSHIIPLYEIKSLTT